MSQHLPHGTHPAHETPPGNDTSHGKHGWMMIACCIPMLAIVGVLVLTGVISPGFIFFAIGCTAMMALMMRGMSHGGENHA